ISSVSFASSISMSSTSKFHFGAAGIDIGADTNINRPASGVLGFNINSAEKFRIDSSGHIKAVGVCTATHFYGDGSNLTGITGTTINSNADNRIITGSGTANTLNGEANLTFDGNNINQTIDNSGEGIRITAPNNHYSVLRFDSNVSSANGSICNIQGHWNGNEVANIIFAAGSDTTNKDDGYIRIYTRESGQSNTERLRITSTGDLTFLNSSTAATADLSSIIFSNNSGEISRIRGQSRNGNTNGM
ncbi:MAG: hypothetical protein VXY93_15435, partial [Pseudomonadota bacterium]|nr:hypothetical protein [Pseudomonadota bacterium]